MDRRRLACVHPVEYCRRPDPEMAEHPWAEDLALCAFCGALLLAPARRAAAEERRRARGAELRSRGFAETTA